MGFFKAYWAQEARRLILPGVSCVIFAAAFALYSLPLGAVAYPALLCAVLWLCVAAKRCAAARRRHLLMQQAMSCAAEELAALLPAPQTLAEADERALLTALCQAQQRRDAQHSVQYADMVAYYMTWAHQIKTPIAAMRLTLQGMDSAEGRRLSGELRRIEQYVEMVLAFLRLDSDTNDLVLRRTALDEPVRQAVRKYADEFIDRHIRLDYAPLDESAVTDGKWLGFVVEQLLSNALKYTPPGGMVRIALTAPKTLVICDTGVGIAAEDLPRVFERGYTGYNGRADVHASGLGLYLCRRVCTMLHHRIWAESTIGEGTSVFIDLAQHDVQGE